MTRREWLLKNPPPRAAKSTQALLDGLNAQNKGRASLIDLRQQWVRNREWWQQRVTLPNEAAAAQQNIAEANRQIGAADAQLLESADVPGRILQLEDELKRAAKCPIHHIDLYRNMNRPEDMFTCEAGPHHLLWTRINGAAALLSLADLSVPSLEYPMTDGKAISRAQWLASHPPLNVVCPLHPQETIPHKPEDRIDVFRCAEAAEQILLWAPDLKGQGALSVFANGKSLPPLEEAI